MAAVRRLIRTMRARWRLECAGLATPIKALKREKVNYFIEQTLNPPALRTIV